MRFGIDIGGTKAHAIAIDDERRTLAELRMPTGQGEAQVLNTIRAAITELSRLAPAGSGPVRSLGIGIPGSVDAERGVVTHAVNLGVTELDIVSGVRHLVDGPVRIDNDMNAAALGAHDRMGDRSDSLAYLNVGTGLAAGLVIRGEVWRGHDGLAGEIGHVPVAGNDVECLCGQIGCLETEASGIAIARVWTANPVSAGRSLDQGLADGDPLASEVRKRVVRGVSDAIQMLLVVVGVELVVVGGGVVLNIPGVYEGVLETLNGRAARSPFIANARFSERLRLVPAGSDIPAVGSALLALGAR